MLGTSEQEKQPSPKSLNQESACLKAGEKANVYVSIKWAGPGVGERGWGASVQPWDFILSKDFGFYSKYSWSTGWF